MEGPTKTRGRLFALFLKKVRTTSSPLPNGLETPLSKSGVVVDISGSSRGGRQFHQLAANLAQRGQQGSCDGSGKSPKCPGKALRRPSGVAFSNEPSPNPALSMCPEGDTSVASSAREPSNRGEASVGAGRSHIKLSAQLMAKSMKLSRSASSMHTDEDGGSVKGSDAGSDGGGNGELAGPWASLDTRSWPQRAWARLVRWHAGLNVDPDSRWYGWWFGVCVAAALASGWLLPFYFAFFGPGPQLAPYYTSMPVSEYVATAIFLADCLIKCYVTYYDPEDGSLVTSKLRIARRYAASTKFLMDCLGWVPLDWIAIEVAASLGGSRQLLLGLAWLRLLHLARLYRLFELFALLDHRMVISQGALMLLRNYTYVFYVTHFAACVLYHIAQHEGLSPASWVGRNADRFDGKPLAAKYVQALYFAVCAFQGMGDGDLYAATVAEAGFMIFYLLFNLLLGAYILGTVTMLVVKGDERSKAFRERTAQLSDFASNNELPERLQSAMQEHLEVSFNVEQVSDEQVLGIYPSTIRRKVLRHLYLQPVRGCYLFKGCKQRFLDALLTAAHVELFLPGVQILTQGENVTELLIVVVGQVLVAEAGIDVNAAFAAYAGPGGGGGGGDSSVMRSSRDGSASMGHRSIGRMSTTGGSMRGSGSMHGGGHASMRASMKGDGSGSRAGSTSFVNLAAAGKQVAARSSSDPLAEVPYFADIPSNETVMCQTVVRALSLPKTAWEALTRQYPQQARVVLANLQANAEAELATELQEAAEGAMIDEEDIRAALVLAKDKAAAADPDGPVEHIRDVLTPGQLDHLVRLDNVRTVVRSHVRKVDQGRVFEFLGFASEGKVEALRTMLSQGVSPNCCDYDGRTGLMLAAVGGHEAAARLLLDSGAKSDQLDSFGNTAMSEGVKNSHDNIVDLLLAYGGTLGLSPMAVAPIMCTAVFEGDVVRLKRLLRAGAPPDACDYDRRCALHIAGAEGNLAAVKLLVEEGGADPGFEDRWGNTALDEARRVGAAPVVAYLQAALHKSDGAKTKKRQRDQVATDFLSACSAGEAERVRLALLGASPPGCALTGLLLAAAKGHQAVVEAIAAWAPPETLHTDGHVPLAEAARMGHVAAAAVLRAWGARLRNPRDPGLVQHLRDAVHAGDERAVAALLAAGLEVAAPSGRASGGGGCGAVDGAAGLLHAAAAAGKLEVVRRLVEHGDMAPGAHDSGGTTPAAIAESRGHGAVAEYLRWAAAATGKAPPPPPAPASGTGAAAASPGSGPLAAAAAAKYGALPDLTQPPQDAPQPASQQGSPVLQSGGSCDTPPLLLAHLGPDAGIHNLGAARQEPSPGARPVSRGGKPAKQRRNSITALLRMPSVRDGARPPSAATSPLGATPDLPNGADVRPGAPAPAPAAPVRPSSASSPRAHVPPTSSARSGLLRVPSTLPVLPEEAEGEPRALDARPISPVSPAAAASPPPTSPRSLRLTPHLRQGSSLPASRAANPSAQALASPFRAQSPARIPIPSDAVDLVALEEYMSIDAHAPGGGAATDTLSSTILMGFPQAAGYTAPGPRLPGPGPPTGTGMMQEDPPQRSSTMEDLENELGAAL